MNLKLVPHDDPILHHRIAEFTGDPRELAQYVGPMFDIMRNDGIGLAAPQVGIAERFFIRALGKKPKSKSDVMICINPEIRGASTETETKPESCLTMPGREFLVTRPKSIDASWIDLKGHRRQSLLYGVAARCFQHELDHLNGYTIWTKPR